MYFDGEPVPLTLEKNKKVENPSPRGVSFSLMNSGFDPYERPFLGTATKFYLYSGVSTALEVETLFDAGA